MKNKKFWIPLIIVSAIAAYCSLTKKNNKVEKIPEIKAPVENVPKLKTLNVTSLFFTDMENPDPGLWIGEKSEEKKKSGNFSSKLSDKIEYGITFLKKGVEIPEHEKIKQARISFQVFCGEPLKKASLVYAVTGTPDKMFEYFQEGIKSDMKKWNPVEIVVPVNPSVWGTDALVKIYTWNEGKEFFYIDDVKIEFFSEVEKQSGIVPRLQQNFIYDFEPENDTPPAGNRSSVIAHSGRYSTVLSGSDTYSENIVRKFSEVATDTVKFISTSVWIYPKEDNPVIALVVALEKPDGTRITWQGKATDRMQLKKNAWHKINFRADLREIKTSPQDIAKVYLWNKNGGTVYADDLEIVYGDVPKPEGITAGVTINLAGDRVTIFGKNKLPFIHSTFSQDPIFQPASGFLIDHAGKKEGDIYPTNLILAGNFLTKSSKQDDIFISDNSNWSIYTWCAADKQFMVMASGKSSFPITGKIALTGSFENQDQEEILLIDTIGKVNIQTIKFTGLAGNICDKNITKEIKQELSIQEIPTMDLRAGSWNITAGNFTGDSRQEIIFISSVGKWKLIEKKKTGYEISGSGNYSAGNVLSINPLASGYGNDRLLLFSERNRKPDYCLLDFKAGNNNCSVIELKDKSFLDYFSTESSFFSGRFEKQSAPCLFYMNNEWRFDLKKIYLTNEGIFIESQIDFEQQDANRNPKYYEYTKLISGNFFGNRSDEFLIIMKNCKDAGFDGSTCTEFEEVNGMPSGYLFYQYKQAD